MTLEVGGRIQRSMSVWMTAVNVVDGALPMRRSTPDGWNSWANMWPMGWPAGWGNARSALGPNTATIRVAARAWETRAPQRSACLCAAHPRRVWGCDLVYPRQAVYDGDRPCSGDYDFNFVLIQRVKGRYRLTGFHTGNQHPIGNRSLKRPERAASGVWPERPPPVYRTSPDASTFVRPANR